MDKTGRQGHGEKTIDEQLLGELLSHPYNLIYRYNLADDRFTFISHSIESVVGVSPEMLLSGTEAFFLPYLHPGDKSKIAKLLKQLKSEPKDHVLTIEYRLRHVEGRDTWVSDNIKVVEAGQDRFLIGNARQVPWMTLASRLEESRELLFQYLPYPYFRQQVSDGRLLACNDALWKSLNFQSREECLRNCCLSSYCPAETRQILTDKLLKDGFLDRVEVEGQFDGRPYWAEVSARYFPEQGVIEGVSRDISPLKLLTPAERTVLELVLNGLSNKEIAQSLNRSIRTVEDHRAHIMQKLHAQNLIDLVQKTYLLFSQPM